MRHIKYKIALFLSPISAFWIIFARKNYPLNANSLFKIKSYLLTHFSTASHQPSPLEVFPSSLLIRALTLSHRSQPRATILNEFAPVHLTPKTIWRQLKRSPPPWGPSPSPCQAHRGRKTYAQWTPCSPVQKFLLWVQVALQKLQMRIP